jgi:cytochrome o ubiquinol oxidase operon protein cyoD
MATSKSSTSQFRNSQIDPASGSFGRRNAARYVGGTVAGESHASVKSYMIGFVLSIILTAIPFGLVMNQNHYGFTAGTVLAAVLLLAVVQVFVHVVYFLHMDRSAEQRWNVVAFAFTVMILVIVVSGSVWIMHNANNNMAHGENMGAEGTIPVSGPIGVEH